jgi:GMP synthase (glutamine-hydrolysing)
VKRILYVSQLADPADPRRLLAPPESETVPPLLAALGATVVVHDATLAPAPSPAGFDGVMVGGSFGSANDREAWRVVLEDWLATHRDVPLLGICGGHQLLARALGGTVEVAPIVQLGVFPLDLTGVEGYGGVVLQLHAERVAAPPAGAHVWAEDDNGIQALRYGPARWTTQFHPEMNGETARAAGLLAGMAEEEWEVATLELAVRGGRALVAAWLAAL